jgi:hypothetical protein
LLYITRKDVLCGVLIVDILHADAMVEDEVVEATGEDSSEGEDHQDVEDEKDIEVLLLLGHFVGRLALVEDQLGVTATVGYHSYHASGILKHRAL